MRTTSRISIVIVTICANACVMNPFENLELGSAQSYRALTLIPVYANNNFIKHRRYMGGYLTLKEAVDDDKVRVTEHVSDDPRYGGPEVNTLYIENISADTVLILNGEVVTGGSQDRMVQTDVVLVPHSGKIDLSVYCVEAHRWQGDSDAFSVVENSLPPNEIRMAAMNGSSQETVWERVESKLNKNDVHSENSRILDIRLDSTFQEHVKNYVAALRDAFREKSEIIGVVVVSGSEVIGCELFATNNLFKKHFPNLLQSYASQVEDTHTRAMNQQDVEAFWRRVMITLKGDDGFLRTAKNLGRKKDPAHFTMINE